MKKSIRVMIIVVVVILALSITAFAVTEARGEAIINSIDPVESAWAIIRPGTEEMIFSCAGSDSFNVIDCGGFDRAEFKELRDVMYDMDFNVLMSYGHTMTTEEVINMYFGVCVE